MKRTFQPSNRKRKNKHGFRERMKSKDGRKGVLVNGVTFAFKSIDFRDHKLGRLKVAVGTAYTISLQVEVDGVSPLLKPLESCGNSVVCVHIE